ncbi:MAG: GTP-binding protein [Marmoricola sp.]
MSALVEGAKRLLGRKSDLGAQVGGLADALAACEGRIEPEQLAPANALVDRVSRRLKLSADHTVVALAGATGSGKSSTFNALTGIDLAAVGVRRPTTSWASACVWGPDGADEVMEWLGIPPRHRTTRDSLLQSSRENDELQGLVLLDLPDHDSTEVAHHIEVDRLIVMADVMIWVLDPQKYADAAIHDRFLKPLAMHKDVMVVVLNHIDRVPQERRESMVGDVRRLLALDGLEGVPVVPISAREGIGVDQLRDMIAKRVADKKNSQARFRTDVREQATALDKIVGHVEPREIEVHTRRELNDAVADAAGVPVVVSAVQRAAHMRAVQATGWPPVKWLGKLRPDPLKRLHLDLGASGKDIIGKARSSVPTASSVQQARVDAAVRHVAEEASHGLSKPWAAAVRRASVSQRQSFIDTVDTAVGQTDLGMSSVPWWCRVIQGLQWVLMLTALAGAGWLAALMVMGYLQMPKPETPMYYGFPLPTLMLVLAVALGVLLALLSRVFVSIGAKSRARAADKRMRSAIDGVTEELILAPISAELETYKQARTGIERALH